MLTCSLFPCHHFVVRWCESTESCHLSPFYFFILKKILISNREAVVTPRSSVEVAMFASPQAHHQTHQITSFRSSGFNLYLLRLVLHPFF